MSITDEYAELPAESRDAPIRPPEEAAAAVSLIAATQRPALQEWTAILSSARTWTSAYACGQREPRDTDS